MFSIISQNLKRAGQVLAAVFMLLQTTIPVMAMATDSPGNNGTLKVHEFGTASGTESNDPKVCAFNFEGFGFDFDQDGYVIVEPQSGSSTDSATLPFGPTDSNGYYSTVYLNNGGEVLDDGHYKATLYGKDTSGNQPNLDDEKAKSKVFKVVCEDEALGKISGYKWNDADGNKNQNDGTEPKLADWKIFLDKDGDFTWDADELHDLTNTEGKYEFTNLPLGTYTICEVMQTGWEQTHPNPDNGSGCMTTTLDTEGEKVYGKNFGNRQIRRQDPCAWPQAQQNDCFDASVVVEPCGNITGALTGGVTNKPTWTYKVYWSETQPTGTF